MVDVDYLLIIAAFVLPVAGLAHGPLMKIVAVFFEGICYGAGLPFM